MFKAKLTDRATQVRFLRFVISGLTVMGVQTGGLAVLSRWWNSTLAFIGSYCLAVLVHYSLNRFWALQSNRTDVLRQAGEYGLTVLMSFLLNFTFFQMGIHLFGLSPVWASLVTNPPTTILVFLILNFRVFRA